MPQDIVTIPLELIQIHEYNNPWGKPLQMLSADKVKYTEALNGMIKDIIQDQDAAALTGMSETYDIPEYIFALVSQSALETGNGTSNIFKVCRNLFGMRPSAQRDRFWQDVHSTLTNGKFAKYGAYTNSILDRLDWDITNDINFTTVEEYAKEVINNGYVTASEAQGYFNAWMHNYESLAKLTGVVDPDGGKSESIRREFPGWVPLAFIAIIGLILSRVLK